MTAAVATRQEEWKRKKKALKVRREGWREGGKGGKEGRGVRGGMEAEEEGAEGKEGEGEGGKEALTTLTLPSLPPSGPGEGDEGEHALHPRWLARHTLTLPSLSHTLFSSFPQDLGEKMKESMHSTFTGWQEAQKEWAEKEGKMEVGREGGREGGGACSPLPLAGKKRKRSGRRRKERCG